MEQSLPTPDARGSNPVIGKHLNKNIFYCQQYSKDENKEKEAGNGPFEKIMKRRGVVVSALKTAKMVVGLSPVPDNKDQLSHGAIL